MGTEEVIIEPVVKYGFVGMACVQLGVIIWMIRMGIMLLTETNKTIERNTMATEANTQLAEKQKDATWALHNKIISRPCIAKGEVGD